MSHMRYFTAIPLLEYMLEKKIIVTGTIMKSRLPRSVQLTSEKTMPRLGRCPLEMSVRADGEFSLVQWFDMKNILLVSTGLQVEPQDECKRWSKKDSGVSALTSEQKTFYEDNGYILIKNNVNPDLLDEFSQRFIDICNGKTEKTSIMTIVKDPYLKKEGAKGEYLINKIQDFAYDDVFWKYISNKNVVDVVEAIIGPNITAVHSMFINKPPNSDANFSLHPLHQDLHYFPFRPADKIVASWTASENVDENNGCLYVVPGSHKRPLYKHSYPEADGKKMVLYHGVQGFEHLPKTFVVMGKGDTVFFHPLLLHGSGPNYTKGFRKAISCHYANSNCDFINVKGTIQEDISKEMESVARRIGINLTFQDIWRYKSRLVRGAPGKFQTLESKL